MNAMIMISNTMPMAHSVCQKHQVRKIQAGTDQICPKCAVELVNNQNREHHKQVQQMVLEKHFAGAMIPKRHANSGFKNYIVNIDNPGQAYARNSCVQFTEAMLDGKKSNLVMSGKTGTGKTHLSCATARTLLKKGIYVRYITSAALAQDIMGSWERADDTEKNTIYRYTEYDLLILDEYGLHDREKRLELVHKVLYARYDEMKPTMLISNLTLAKLQEDLGDRLWSRFQHGGLTAVECNWGDKRIGCY